jgi:RimJ/RimL family protein N-acetyltransferase
MSSVPHVLETDRLLLRPWTSEDVALLATLSSNPRVTRYIGLGQTWTALKAITVSDRALDHWREHGFGWRVVVHVSSGTEIGLLALNRMGDGTPGLEPDEYEIGWWLSPDRWGHGYATEGARAVAEDAFTSLGAPRLTARILPENAGSIAVAESIGMGFEFNTVAEPGVLVAVYRSSAPADDVAA